MAHVYTKSEIKTTVSGSNQDCELSATYEYGHTAFLDLSTEDDAGRGRIELTASELDEFIAGLRKVRGAMAGDD